MESIEKVQEEEAAPLPVIEYTTIGRVNKLSKVVNIMHEAIVGLQKSSNEDLTAIHKLAGLVRNHEKEYQKLSEKYKSLVERVEVLEAFKLTQTLKENKVYLWDDIARLRDERKATEQDTDSKVESKV